MSQEKEMQQLRDKIAAYEKIIEETSVPIIPSIVDNTILVPVAGVIVQERFKMIQHRVLDYIGKNRDVQHAIFDFSAVNTNEVAFIDYNMLATEIGQLHAALKLMGVRSIFVGFNPGIVKEIVIEGAGFSIETYINFKMALSVLLNEHDKALQTVKPS